MMHPLVEQLRFTRKEFLRGLQDVSEADGQQRLGPMNSLGWIVAHLAWHEQLCWLTRAQGIVLVPEVHQQASGQPASTPSLAWALDAWGQITQATDPWLDTLTSQQLTAHSQMQDGTPAKESIGSTLLRMRHHYWFHLGESQAIRQVLGHTQLPKYIGPQHAEAPYIPEH